MAFEINVPISADIPNEGCFKPWNDGVRFKVEVERSFSVSGEGDTMPEFGSSPASAVSASLTHTMQHKFGSVEASAGYDLDTSGFVDVISSGNPREAATTCLEALSASLTGKFDLCRFAELSAGAEAAFDSDLCFFTVSAELNFHYDLPVRGGQTTLASGGSVKLHFGPGLRVYGYVAQRVGVPVVEQFLRRVLPRMATEGALVGVLQALNIWAFAIQSGVDIMHLSQWICRTAYQRGVHRGQAHKYASAYLYTLYLQNGYYVPSPDSIERGAIAQARADIHRLGYALLRRRMEERYNGRRHLQVNQTTGFAVNDSALGPVIWNFGEALDRGAF
jgi:hypothetical protein